MHLQWLIDIIVALIEPTDIYVDRGDIGSADFTIGDFTRDGNWHTLDLSGIVPENVTAVNIRITIKSTTSNRNLQFRTKGNVNQANVFLMTTQNPIAFFPQMGLIYPNADREIEYNIVSTSINQLFMTINGWWLKKNI